MPGKSVSVNDNDNTVNNLVWFQGYLACVNLGAVDVEERKKAGITSKTD